uniref:Uncharacterized protein n=1 Tax=Wuchereria bancrofti TaxID=6293 RepID=A0A1I8EQS1_WUCBA
KRYSFAEYKYVNVIIIDYRFKEELIKTLGRVEDLYSFEGFKFFRSTSVFFRSAHWNLTGRKRDLRACHIYKAQPRYPEQIPGDGAKEFALKLIEGHKTSKFDQTTAGISNDGSEGMVSLLCGTRLMAYHQIPLYCKTEEAASACSKTKYSSLRSVHYCYVFLSEFTRQPRKLNILTKSFLLKILIFSGNGEKSPISNIDGIHYLHSN